MTNKSLLRSSLVNNRWYETMLVGNSAFIPVTYELIETIPITSNTSSITFANLASFSTTYRHLQIRGTGRSNRGDDNSAVGIRFNGDTGSNYSFHNIQTLSGNWDTANSGSHTSITLGYTLAAATTASGHYGGFIIDILEPYNSNKFKTVKAFSGQPSGRNFICVASGNWRNTNSVTSVTLIDAAGTNFVSGSSFSLYGIRR